MAEPNRDASTEADDLRQIMALLADYCLTLDEGRFEDHLALYDDSCRLHVFGKDFEGRERIDRFMRRAHRGKHLAGVPHIRLDGDTASSTSDFVFFRHDMQLNSCGSYRDEFVRTPEGWRFCVRRIEIQLRAED
ncbi:MAG: nuclear transport factor 2 family protein [Myxococcota bacterium]|nr:nuclear transport factor 2 family protein [Myxococcota bacterium]